MTRRNRSDLDADNELILNVFCDGTDGTVSCLFPIAKINSYDWPRDPRPVGLSSDRKQEEAKGNNYVRPCPYFRYPYYAFSTEA
jgi:hypothetical protein